MHRPRFTKALGFLLCAWPGAALAGPEQLRYPIDKNAIRHLEAAGPELARLFFEGEERFRAGDFSRASELFKSVLERAPKNPLALRRSCQALAELGRRQEALWACQQVLSLQGTPLDQRAMVGALMLGPEPPTTEEVVQAVTLANAATERLPEQPWGFASKCDIARRLDDASAYKRCLADLVRVAPEHYETKRAAAGLLPQREGWQLFGWVSILLAALGTAIHAGAALFARVRSRAARAGVVALLALPATAADAWAQSEGEGEGSPSSSAPAAGTEEKIWQLSRYRINYDDPESSVPTGVQRDKNPLEFGYHLQDLAAEGQKREDKGDVRGALKFWRALAKAVPESNAGFFRACRAYEKLGERELAVEYCGKAIALPPDFHPDEFARYAALLLSKEGALSAAEVLELDQLISHLRDSKSGNGEVMASQIECQLGLSVNDVRRLDHCTTFLSKQLPNDPRTVTFQWALAIKRGNLSLAEAQVARAKKLKFPAQSVEHLERGLADAKSARWKRWAQIGGSGVALFGALFFLGVMLRRKLRERSASRKLSATAPPVVEDQGPTPSAL